MKRLTFKFDDAVCFRDWGDGTFAPCIICASITCEKCAFAMCLDKLAAYEDIGLDPEELLELSEYKRSNRIYLLPCELGSKVYVITRRTDDFSGCTYPVIIQASFRIDMIDDLNKRVFLTKEEADMALTRTKNER